MLPFRHRHRKEVGMHGRVLYYLYSFDYGRDCVPHNLQMAGSKEIGGNVPED